MSDGFYEDKPHEERVEAIIAKIREFLTERRVSDNDGWPVASTEEYHNMVDLFYDIAESKFANDCDNDTLFSITAINKSIHYPLPYTVVKKQALDENYNYIIDTPASLQAIEDAISVAEQYTGYARSRVRMMQWENKQKEKKQ